MDDDKEMLLLDDLMEKLVGIRKVYGNVSVAVADVACLGEDAVLHPDNWFELNGVTLVPDATAAGGYTCVIH